LTLLRQHTQTAILGSIDDQLTTEDSDSLVFAPEVEQARQQIDQTSKVAILVLLVTMTAAVILTVIIGLLFNRAITRNVVRLTETAVELQSGNLDARAEIDSADELGQLATTLNLLATQITTLVDDLEERAIEAQTRLVAAIENIPVGLSLFDENDRLLLFNSKYKELHDEHSDIIKVGAKFEHIMRSTAEKGRYVDAADGRLDEWIGQRLARHQKPSGAF
jgi:nitrogen fixation/metabolism regulation signal transduction histidine kinase